MATQLFAAVILGCCIGALIAVSICNIAPRLRRRHSKVIKYMPAERSLKVEDFLKELQERDIESFNILDNLLGALTDKVGDDVYNFSVGELDITLALLREQGDEN